MLANIEQTSSRRRANVEQLARIFWIHLLDVCSMLARSCKRDIALIPSDVCAKHRHVYRVAAPGNQTDFQTPNLYRQLHQRNFKNRAQKIYNSCSPYTITRSWTSHNSCNKENTWRLRLKTVSKLIINVNKLYAADIMTFLKGLNYLSWKILLYNF